MAKAFDRVTHKALAEAALEAGVDSKMVRYIVDNYKKQDITLKMQGATGCVKPGRGVRQGDPLSPVLFNLVMNRTLKKLPASTGVMVGEQRVNHLAYADDVVLLAETKTGLQHMLHVYQKGLARCGFVINVKKSATLDMETVPKDRQLVVNISSNFRCGPDSLPSMSAAEFYKYLGVDTGGTRGRAINVLEHKLDQLRRAPFKPQQRLWILKVYVIPSLYQLLVLGRTTRVELLGLDRVIRRTIRRWMAWPKDAPLPMYTTQEGTMGHSRCLNSHGQFHYLKRQLANLEKFKPRVGDSSEEQESGTGSTGGSTAELSGRKGTGVYGTGWRSRHLAQRHQFDGLWDVHQRHEDQRQSDDGQSQAYEVASPTRPKL